MTLVILTEEPSMRVTLENVIPMLGISVDQIVIIEHEGKTDLERSIPRKLSAWKAPNTRFLILRDNDRADCQSTKARLLKLVASTGKQDVTKVRVVCQELEAWFLADLSALRCSGYLTAGKVPAFSKKNPDQIPYPVHEMEKIRPGYGKITGAMEISPHLNPDNQLSSSFRNTMRAIRDLSATEGGAIAPNC